MITEHKIGRKRFELIISKKRMIMAILIPLSGHGNLVDNKCRDYILGIGQWERKNEVFVIS